MGGNHATASVHIGFPVDCKYVGGNTVLGKHGHSFRIEGDRLGHGELHLSHSIPLTDVASVTIAQRGSEEPRGCSPPVAVADMAWAVSGSTMQMPRSPPTSWSGPSTDKRLTGLLSSGAALGSKRSFPMSSEDVASLSADDISSPGPDRRLGGTRSVQIAAPRCVRASASERRTSSESTNPSDPIEIRSRGVRTHASDTMVAPR